MYTSDLVIVNLLELILLAEPASTDISTQQLKYFKPDCLIPSSKDSSLGKTIWLYGEVDNKDEECEQIASEYVNKLLEKTDLKPELVNHGKLLKSLLFEYEATNSKELQNPADKCHIYVSINNTQTNTIELAGKAYDWLLGLLCCYHKINYIYYHSQIYYKNARNLYSQLNSHTNIFNELIREHDTALNGFQILLKKMSPDVIKYTQYLMNLEVAYKAINTNIVNYGICLEKIAKVGECLEFPQDFLNKTCKQWQQQIQNDIDYLSLSQDLFKQMVDTIRGIVAIEQTNLAIHKAEKDADAATQQANLQNTVTTMGFGIGAASAGATTFIYLIPAPQQQKPFLFPLTPGADQPHPVVYALLFAGCCGIVVASIAGCIANKIHKH